MEARQLAVGGAWAFTPERHTDDRGLFTSPFEADVFAAAVGRPLFPVAQASTSVSAKDVVRGVHYARTEPGCAKYVHCPRGRVLDIIVDLRAGSPAFGQWDAVELADHAAVYIPAGLGHAFVALEDDSTVCYLLSRGYVPADELAVSVHGLGLPLPTTPRLSERDRVAIPLERALAGGLLPTY
ncbi:dTDP-4-dehydrorhamnose 3,5-epimerase family protein [Actinophytocola sp. NPDC049390]|uniref:dTDP-4-dehydrorhamnose 3,5-epimerase family protein n=1 Tax=Actinophytocola sp. NPDC049390 TaxID=3363894 RepID=UPI00379662FE